ncbi:MULTISPECIES: bifunctional biotin--[acetyl-CoA-carboxylase] ligase/biotin operon repressor BirA [Pseudomonas]|uniref:bifunctional biotin--[acetyl-CoA-carboxylase] ligase/biotin operon repressor BirA n=1 Tax=Pseudomonas TaxID=286 RepID=UPI001B003CCB|nr:MULTISPECIES: bifunctional biotin--[acetyl-CoA-carboxylase] ligase/biotin operon repressor BirA [Pseudomonas]MBO6279301.1 bifunctional biotin--[acetyl-CoA-carboxylase] ligase/biotin operon repressor BirA [Pseudomonas sp.]MBP3861875.1 bifunctional biotin--[acetyl-CoA-carboxylase] ligase/biotin operon repressor BirA [Pseudomonas sp.]MCF3194779.1 bifunctional biotin--[acetyl-CoA-carboxylase] ligase/biotin operon repressor BirA [Pseudomonas bubulae]MCK6250874.1 bifunctional biotin--[acetyl-CoA-c
MLTLLKLLKDGRFHSGQALGAALGVSRSAVWKQLQHLESDLNLSIHKVRGRGYQLAAPLELLEQEQLDSSPWPVLIHHSLDSTNAEALRAIDSGAAAPFVVTAERQTAGRGRRGRKWVSPFAENIYYSLVLRMDGGMRQLEGLSLVVGLAVLSALRAVGLSDAGLKWPNDVLVGNKKIAGILLELVGDPADVCHVVLGIGINVNMRLASEVDQAWTSVFLESGRLVNRNTLISRLNDSLLMYLKRHAAEGFTAIQAEWEQNHLWQGREVSLIAGVHQVDGTVMGIDQQGALRMSVNGEVKVYSGGELSLRLRHDS